MNPILLGFWGLVGWCGTPYPGWWRFPPPPPPPDPFRSINVAMIKTIGTIGGLVGGAVYTQVFPIEGTLNSLNVAPTAIGAVVGSIFLSELYLLSVGFRQTQGLKDNQKV